jgi:hypothetical protein
MRDDYLFANRATIHDVIETQRQQTENYLDGVSSSDFGQSLDALVTEVVGRFRLDVPVIDRARIVQLPNEEADIDVSGDPYRPFLGDEPYYVKGTAVSIAVPFRGEAALLQFGSSPFNSPIRGRIVDDTIVLHQTTDQPDAARIRKEFDNTIERIDATLQMVRGPAEEWNRQLPELVRRRLEQRQTKLQQTSSFNLGYPAPAQQAPAEKTKFRSGVFISYSHADAEWLKRLQIHLAPYVRGENLDVWDDTRIRGGASWAREIEGAIESARVAVLLVTPEFLASDYVASVELPAIVRRAGADITILWIPIRAASFHATPLKDYQAAYDPSRPLATLSRPKQDQALVGIAKKIAAAVDVNAVANALKIIDEFEPQAKAFVTGTPEPEQPVVHAWRAEQVETTIRLVEPSGTHQLITAEGLEKLDQNAQKLIRAYERTMKELFERWTELKPKRYAQDPQTRQEAREESDNVRTELCMELNGLLGFIESLAERISLFGEYGLVNQLGCSEYRRPRRFRERLEQWLTLVRVMWPECPAQISRDGRHLLVNRANALTMGGYIDVCA